MWTIRQVFEPGGFFSKQLPGYELRQPQIDLSLAIEGGISEGYHVAAEGPCGSGKSLAYLTPAIRQVLTRKAGPHNDDRPESNRIIVATANIALQEQLAEKDLPFLQEALPDPFTFAMVKGRNNYLCQYSLDEFRKDKAQGLLEFGKNVMDVPVEKVYPVMSEVERAICKWSKETKTGDKSELTFQPPSYVWSQFSVTAEECTGSTCEFSDKCFANKARGALQLMDVIVTNYHLLFAAIRVREETGMDIVFPPFDYLICDEGHRVADIARDFFGWTISRYTITRLSNKLRKGVQWGFATGQLGDSEKYRELASTIESQMDAYWREMDAFYGDSKGAFRIRDRDTIGGAALAQTLTDSSRAFANLRKLPISADHKSDLEKQGLLCIKVAEQIRECRDLADDNGVYYLEKFGRSQKLRLVKRKLKVADLLWDEMFMKTRSTIVTSATMAIEGDCSYVRDEVGMKKGREIVVESPFDWRSQARILLSKNAPDPKCSDYAERVSKNMVAIIEQAKGRTLGLFTSYRMLNYAAEYLRKELPQFTFLVQGEAPRTALVEEFRSNIDSVLLGTESFWQGVDVSGEALSCLVIDKIPFPAPGDPVLDALGEAAGNGQGFWKVSVPRAVLQFRQGVGRLIRRRDDRGVVVILDNRLVTKGYGSIFVSSLPRMTRLGGLKRNEIAQFLAEKDKSEVNVSSP